MAKNQNLGGLPQNPEKIAVPEKKIEVERPVPERREVKFPAKTFEEKRGEVPVIMPAPRRGGAGPITEKSETLMKIENILEEDLQDIYFDLPKDARPKFKAKGEETATKIESLISKDCPLE